MAEPSAFLRSLREQPTLPSAEASTVLERWIEGKIAKGRELACPDELQERAIANGKKLGMEVVILFTNEWQVRMTTKRGSVCAAPMIDEQTCQRCRGSHVIPHILDGGGRACDVCKGKSVTLEQAWRNALEELGLMSS